MQKRLLALWALALVVPCAADTRPLVQLGTGIHSGLVSVGIYSEELKTTVTAGMGTVPVILGTVDGGSVWSAQMAGSWHPWGRDGAFVGGTFYYIEDRGSNLAFAPDLGYQKAWKHFALQADVGVPFFHDGDRFYSRMASLEDQDWGAGTFDNNGFDIYLGAGVSYAF